MKGLGKKGKDQDIMIVWINKWELINKEVERLKIRISIWDMLDKKNGL